MKLRCLFVAILLALWPLFAYATAPTLDASGIFTGSFNSTSSGSVSVSTTSTNDVIIIFIQSTKRTGAAATVSSISGGGLTWANRTALTATYTAGCFAGNTCHGDFEEWWAFSSTTLTGTSVTVTLSGTTDEAAMVAFGVNGAGSSLAPFDTNVGLPATAQNLTSTPSTISVTLSTIDNSDLIFAAFGSGNQKSLAAETCTGWVQGGLVDSSGPNDYATLWALAKGFTSVQTSLAITFFGGGCAANQATDAYTVIGDAVTNGIVPPPGISGSLLLLDVGQ